MNTTRRLFLSMLTGLVLFPLGALARAEERESDPAFRDEPQLIAGYRLLYEQKFEEGRKLFTTWSEQHPSEPLGPVAIAASYLFDELMEKGVLTSEFFMDDNKFLKGIEGKPDPVRMKGFLEGLARGRELAKARLKARPKDPGALFCLTLAAGMESNANSMLLKKPFDALKRMKEANENAKLLLAQRPDAQDAWVALGSANYIIGSLSAGFRMLLWFGNVHGDKELGMQQTEKAAINGRYLRPFAKILLALAARRERQVPLARKMLKELTEEFPASKSFAAEYKKALAAPVSPAKS
ncbi:MAG TPA: hypothetical protein VK525_08715 [Candidatus Saccharimonadales bacterium]|nr:hypothetical protein [Candidatus Saccharimonadales bacterium]